jgi:hypothetical protein
VQIKREIESESLLKERALIVKYLSGRAKREPDPHRSWVIRDLAREIAEGRHRNNGRRSSQQVQK